MVSASCKVTQGVGNTQVSSPMLFQGILAWSKRAWFRRCSLFSADV